MPNVWMNDREARDLLRASLVKLVGTDGEKELEQLKIGINILPMSAEDRESTLAAVQALIDTLPLWETHASA